MTRVKLIQWFMTRGSDLVHDPRFMTRVKLIQWFMTRGS